MPTQQLARTLDWGPAIHDPENPFSHSAIHSAIEAALDRRNADDERPDDN